MQSIMDYQYMEISFPIDDSTPHWKYQPESFLGSLVGDESAGSLHSYLKNNGWITSLSAGGLPLGRGFGTFRIMMHLTKEGFRWYLPVFPQYTLTNDVFREPSSRFLGCI